MADPARPVVGQWALSEAELFSVTKSSALGLTTDEARDRLRRLIPTRQQPGFQSLRLFTRQFQSPIILLLLTAAVLSFFLGETVDAIVVVAIVVISGALGFQQERGAVRAVEELIGSVKVHSEVLRDGIEKKILIDEVVPGDVVVLKGGDLVPGDCRVLTENQLEVDESALTGENYPRHKHPGVVDAQTGLAERSNSLYFGTHVATGEGVALVVTTGEATEFGRLQAHIFGQHVPTSFERGTTAFGYLLMRATLALVIAVFIINIVLHRPVVDSLLFSLALAVGLTPQLLPAIITFSLSRGAVVMARKKVIVKRLDSIEDIGSLDVLCTDKTGTLTVGAVALHSAIGIDGGASVEVARLARLNATLQKGFTNPIDSAIASSHDMGNTATGGSDSLGEIPFDFSRKRMTVKVRTKEEIVLVTKGAFESVVACCTKVALVHGQQVPMEVELPRLRSLYESKSNEGLRVLGLATKSTTADAKLDVEAESEMTFLGLLVFADPPKVGAREALARLAGLGVSVRLITGDNALAAAHTARSVGLDADRAMAGPQLTVMSDEQLQAVVEDIVVFAETDPMQKERIVRALSSAGHTVGFLGDGINDSPALHVADVGISVDSAVDIAKQSADLVLLDKDLGVLTDGIEQGRRVFANTLKYVYVNTSAQFGNMLSLAMAAMVLPFLPLLPLQILLLNFLSDIPGMSIATDRVDAERLKEPHKWDIHRVRNFMIVFGTVSSVFDMITFAVLRWVFHAGPELLRTGWFVESTFTELAVMLVLRTSRPAFRSRPSNALMYSSIGVAAITLWFPFSFIAHDLGFVPLSAIALISMLGITCVYVLATETLKQVTLLI